MDLGYFRVSSSSQVSNSSNNFQKEMLKQRGVLEKNIYSDVCSGKTADRSGLIEVMNAAINCTDPQSIIHITAVDRFSRSVRDGIELVYKLSDNNVLIQFDVVPLDVDDLARFNMYVFLLTAAQWEFNTTKERTRQGIEIAKTAGVYKGKEKILQGKKWQEFKKDHFGGMAPRKLCVLHDLSRTSVYRYRKIANEEMKTKN